MDFIYRFDMSKDIAHFKRFPQNVQSSAECNAVKVIYESFVVPADEDYLMSRLLAQEGLFRGFYWAAAQAVEKYLKAFLLINGEGVKNFKGHPLRKLFDAAIKIDKSIASLDILPHKNIGIIDSVPQLFRIFTPVEFIGEIEKYGCADNRYNAFGVEYNAGYLYALDSFSFKLRKQIEVLPIKESFKKLSRNMVLVFERNNLWYQGEADRVILKIPSKELSFLAAANTTTLDFLRQNKSNTAYRLALEWLDGKMKLPESK